MKGNDIPPVTKIDDSRTNSKTLSTKHIKTDDTTVKSKLKQQASESAVSDTHINSENLTEVDQVTIEELRQIFELQKQVQKEKAGAIVFSVAYTNLAVHTEPQSILIFSFKYLYCSPYPNIAVYTELQSTLTFSFNNFYRSALYLS